MRTPNAFLSLPPSLLLLLAAQLHAHGGARAEKDGLQTHTQTQPRTQPTAVRKMSLDEGEKFMPEYYAFAAPPDWYGGEAQAPLGFGARDLDAQVLTPEERALLTANSSAALAFRPPFPLHYDYRGREARYGVSGRGSGSGNGNGSRNPRGQGGAEAEAEAGSWSFYRRAMDALARLQGRDFACPGGTHVCSNINQPNYCCTDGTTCFVVEDAPDAGNVGCCPEGQSCGGSVATCADGNTACPAQSGGGCCIPGFVCADIGCVQSTVSATTPTSSAAPSSTSISPSSSSSISPSSSSSVSSSASPSSSTSTSTSTTESESTTSSPSSASGTGLPPVRPTSSGPQPTDTKTTTTAASDYCPTGFYGCVASAGSGCCRTGRDCSTTSCPPVASTTIITHGATIVVPLTDAQAAAAASSTPTATCANGWFLCDADAGAIVGCCPSGYVCGTASCTLSAATATATVQKELPGSEAGGGWAGMRIRGRGGVLLAACMALGWGMFFRDMV
ncbi:hypothetical protein F5Y14DRAFT_209302 [Nemania sp. NC0429]|nr:hypothetical protein F5Y14DRAFT_209302 [Nemania sp. NC0429]